MERYRFRSDNQGIRQALVVLGQGGIIAFPTDTVYGIGCDAFNEAGIDRMYRLKKRKREKPFVMFLAYKDLLSNYVLKSGVTARAVFDHFEPGALTLIMKAKRKAPRGLLSSMGTISIRIPEYEFLRKLISQFGKPLATTSANIAGTMSPTRYREMNLHVDLAIKDDSIPCGVASTVLDVSLYPFVLLRKGCVSIFALERFVSAKIRFDRSILFNILFVCTGNSCRSPIAEGIVRKLLKARKYDKIKVSSCGLLAAKGMMATENAVFATAERDYDIRRHHSRPIDRMLVEQSDLILCMEGFQKREIERRFPFAKERVFLLPEYSGGHGDIKDPIGGDLNLYRTVTGEIEHYARKLVLELEKRMK